LTCVVFVIAFATTEFLHSRERVEFCESCPDRYRNPWTRILSIEVVRRNPWHVLSHKLPHTPDPLLLRLAAYAADYCRHSEWLLMDAARVGFYVPPEFQDEPDSPDVSRISEGLAEIANDKLKEIVRLIDDGDEWQ